MNIPIEPSAEYRPRRLSVYEKPLPARLLLARALGISVDEAGLALSALIEGGYGIAPRNPTNGMLAAYIEATAPARNHEAIITAISKARIRWQAMLEQGTAMAMSLKYVPAQGGVTEGGDGEAGSVSEASSTRSAKADAP